MVGAFHRCMDERSTPDAAGLAPRYHESALGHLLVYNSIMLGIRKAGLASFVTNNGLSTISFAKFDVLTQIEGVALKTNEKLRMLK
jgi:hypothetical protein